jgi:hypothetical protein
MRLISTGSIKRWMTAMNSWDTIEGARPCVNTNGQSHKFLTCSCVEEVPRRRCNTSHAVSLLEIFELILTRT